MAILGEKDSSRLPLRVQRFKLQMMRYGYAIFYTARKDMYLADLLSPPCDVDGVSTKHCASVECFVACNAQEILSNMCEQ